MAKAAMERIVATTVVNFILTERVFVKGWFGIEK
jgi:hypothetical protein